jgi:hypothetical protein
MSVAAMFFCRYRSAAKRVGTASFSLLELGRTLSEAGAARRNNFRAFVLPSGNCFE